MMRRGAIRAIVGGSLVVACSDQATQPISIRESSAGTWRTWVLPSGSSLRPAPPPSDASPQTRQELETIIALQQHSSSASDSIVRLYDGAPTARWHTTTLEMLDFYWPLLPDVRNATPVRSARILSLVNVAMYDAIVAVWDAKYAYHRTSPARVDSRVRVLVDVGDVPSYPSEHAAVAAAAAGLLTYLFSFDDTARFSRMAREAGQSRVMAGVSYQSDVDAGTAIGREVAARVIARAKADNSDALWTGTAPSTSWSWRPTPPRRVKEPFDVLAGQWRTWVISSGDVFRPTAPPLPGSDRFTKDLNELLQIGRTRTTAQADTARYWATEAPSSRWEVFMEDELKTHRLGSVQTARALALASTAMYDAMVACWDAKFFYWLERPITADSTLRTALSTPPFPSYPSGHSTQSAAAAEVFAYLFPDRADYYRRKADEASVSRVLAGIHYRFDIEAGEALGRKVGAAAVDRGRADGSP